MADGSQPTTIAIIAGEESGDHLGSRLMVSLRAHYPEARYFGIGGRRMAEEGLDVLYSANEISVFGISALFHRLPRILVILRAVVRAILTRRPDALIIIDSPEFTHAVARRVARRLPKLPIINYVSPSVWAWRPGRARRMRRYVDHVLALLPFEPAVHRRLGGPACTYVGHPLADRISEFRPSDLGRSLDPDNLVLLVLPGSRRGEVVRHMACFGGAVALIAQENPNIEVIIPAVPEHLDEIRAAAARWPIVPEIISGETEKIAVFKRADAALAASGTVTLELALARVPMVVAYRLDWMARQLKWLVDVPTIVLTNLVIEDRVIPDFIDADVNPENLALHLAPLLRQGPERRRQLQAFDRAEEQLKLPSGRAASEVAADVVVHTIGQGPVRQSRPAQMPPASHAI